MERSTVTVKGQTTIPKKIREYLHLKPHESLMFILDGGRVILKPLRGSLSDLKGVLKPSHKGNPINFQKLRAQAKQALAKRALEESP